MGPTADKGLVAGNKEEDLLIRNSLGSSCPYCESSSDEHDAETYLVPDSVEIDIFITCTWCQGYWTLSFKLMSVDIPERAAELGARRDV